LKNVLAAVLCAFFVPLSQPVSAAPLEGSVQQDDTQQSSAPKTPIVMPTPVLHSQAAKTGSGKPLEGKANDSGLKGEASEDDEPDLQAMNARPGSGKAPLKASAQMSGEDQLQEEGPEAADRELAVEWDRWRNRFLSAVQGGLQEDLNNPDDENLRFDPVSKRILLKFPLGTTCWFSAKVSNDRHIVSYRLMHSSGFPGYDKAVERAIRNLDGSSLLRFPKGSHRQVVTQAGGIKTAESSEKQYFHFGDTERYRVPN